MSLLESPGHTSSSQNAGRATSDRSNTDGIPRRCDHTSRLWPFPLTSFQPFLMLSVHSHVSNISKDKTNYDSMEILALRRSPHTGNQTVGQIVHKHFEAFLHQAWDCQLFVPKRISIGGSALWNDLT